MGCGTILRPLTVYPNMRDLVTNLIRETESFVTQMDRGQWTLAFIVVVVFGCLCLRGVGNKTNL